MASDPEHSGNLQDNRIPCAYFPDPYKLEKVLSNRLVRAIFRWMTSVEKGGRTFLEEALLNYGSQKNGIGNRLRYLIPHAFVEIIRRQARADKELLREKVFGDPPTLRAIINTTYSIGKVGLRRPQVFCAPLMVVWNITQACNLKCRHCYQNAGRKRDDELTLDEKLRIVDELGEMDVAILALSGGEPLVCPDIWQVITRAREHGMFITIATNGTLLGHDMTKRLRDAGVEYIEVSLDSVDPDKHDAFRGRQCWHRIVDGIKASVGIEGVEIGIASTITKLNFDELEDLIRFTSDVGCTRFNAFNFIPTGRGRDDKALDITPEQREDMLATLWGHLSQDNLVIMSTAPQLGRYCAANSSEDGVFAAGHAGYGIGPGAKSFARYIGGCGAGRCYSAFQPNGIVTPCVFMPIPVGNLRKDAFRDIWCKSQLLWELRDRDLLDPYCGLCEYRDFCGGCRARAYAYTSDYLQADNGCYWGSIQATMRQTAS